MVDDFLTGKVYKNKKNGQLSIIPSKACLKKNRIDKLLYAKNGSLVSFKLKP